ncbi:MAG: glycosyltransferase family 1 protein [bacterium]|nr:MAG: glycosyltransferase family 1 protein [bacterium]
MRIAIDMSPIIYGTGVSKYRQNLVKNLLKIDTQNEYLLYGGSMRRLAELRLKIDEVVSGSTATSKTYPIPPRLADIIWNKLHILPIEKLIGQADLIHTSDWAEPPSSNIKITTIHDLVPIVLPKFTPKLVRETHRERLKWVQKESKKIIVPSNSTKIDLIKLGFDENRIAVVYEAPNISKASDQEVLEVKKKYSIREDYIIMIGTNLRKNIVTAVNAFHLAKYGKNLKLIIIGENNGLKLKDERGVRFLGFVPDNDLAPLLTGSSLLLFPSLYEGLGVPILEAYTCGVPVVTSDVSSMPEVSAGASILVDPYDVNSIADGIKEALSKPKTLIAKGLARVKDFSWAKTAEETLRVYKEVCE